MNATYANIACKMAFFIVLSAIAFSGGAEAAKSSKADTMNYVRQHKSEGLRVVMLGSEEELMKSAASRMVAENYGITQEPHAIFGNWTNVDESAYALYFYQTSDINQTEVEVLWEPAYDFLRTTELTRMYQLMAFSRFFSLNNMNIERLKDGRDQVLNEWAALALHTAAYLGEREKALKLVEMGANIDLAIASLKRQASKQLTLLDKPLHREIYDKSNLAVESLNGMKKESEELKKAAKRREAEKDNEVSFQAALNSYRTAKVKPQLPEDARKFKVQAEDAVREKAFAEAVDLYGQAIKIAPWWPEGHFNRALVLGETKEYEIAIIEMKRYLALVPKAPNARAAQDKIYAWERKVQK